MTKKRISHLKSCTFELKLAGVKMIVKKSRNNSAPQKPIVFQVLDETQLMSFLIQQMPSKSRNNIKSLLAYRQVLVDGEIATQFNHPLRPGQKVEISSKRISSPESLPGLKIVYEDHDIIVADKPAGLLSVATASEKRMTAYSMLSGHVKKQDPGNKIFIVHRLDRETSGLMLFAKNQEVKRQLQDSWDESVIQRTYIAVVEGTVSNPEGTIVSSLAEDKNFRVHSVTAPAKGQKAITHFEVLKTTKSWSLLKVDLETGRKNQIRVHMQDMGHSVTGDKKYGALSNPLKRLGLHAQILKFIHPVSKKEMNFESQIPKSFLRLVK